MRMWAIEISFVKWYSTVVCTVFLLDAAFQEQSSILLLDFFCMHNSFGLSEKYIDTAWSIWWCVSIYTQIESTNSWKIYITKYSIYITLSGRREQQRRRKKCHYKLPRASVRDKRVALNRMTVMTYDMLFFVVNFISIICILLMKTKQNIRF